MNTKTKQQIIATLLKAERPDLANVVADFRPGSFYDFIPKAVTAVKGLAQAMFKDQRDEDEMADTLVAILKKSVPQSVQSTVFKAMKHLM